MVYYSSMPMWIFFFIVLLFAFITKKSVRGENRKLPPSPPKLPIIGNLHQIRESPHHSLWQLSKKYGPVMLLHLGSVPTVVISSAEAAKVVLKTHDLDCCSRPFLSGAWRLSYNYLDVTFAPYSEYWREIRKVCVLEVFSIKRVQSFRFIRQEETASLINSLSEYAASATSVDLSKTFYALTANIILRTAFGTTYGDTDFDMDQLKELISDAEAVIGGFSANENFPYIGWIVDRISGHYARTERVFHKLDNFFEKTIKDHQIRDRSTDQGQQEDIVDLMLRIEREQTGFRTARITKDHIKAVLFDIFVAGIGTNANTLNWAMAELVKNPRTMRKATNEIRKSIRNKDRVDESDIDNHDLQYLKMIIKEALRLHPPAPLLLPREAMSHFKIEGYDVKPKTMIQVNAWAIGRDPSYWKNPEEFFPERFEGNSIDFNGQNFEYLPFGSGRRICPAINMGTKILELVIANLLYCFNWKLPDGLEDIDMEEETGFSLSISKREPPKIVPVYHF